MAINKSWEERKAEIMELPDDTKFCVQNGGYGGYVGNVVSWWAGNGERKGAGYTCDFDKIAVYTKAEILSTTWRNEDVIWVYEHVTAKIVKMVDSQYLESKFKH